MDNGELAVLKRADFHPLLNYNSSSKDYPVRIKKYATHTATPQEKDGIGAKSLLKCGICSEVFISIHDISNHLQHKHQSIQVFDCGICLKFYPLHHELETHLLECHLQCDTGPSLDLKAPNIDVAEIEHFLKNSEFKEKVELECPFCKCVYNKLALYQQHMSASHRGKAWDKDGLCMAILKVTTVKTSSVKPIIRDNPDIVPPGKVYTCGHCNKKVFGKESMKRHIASHRDGTIIQCAICFEFFISEETFVKHRQTFHLSLNNLNLKQNKHGDIIGSSLEDVLKANDCLSRASCSIERRQIIPAITSEQPKSAIVDTAVSQSSKDEIRSDIVLMRKETTDADVEIVETVKELSTIDCTTVDNGRRVTKPISGTKLSATQNTRLPKQKSMENPSQAKSNAWSDAPKGASTGSRSMITELNSDRDLEPKTKKSKLGNVRSIPDTQLVSEDVPATKEVVKVSLIEKIANALDGVEPASKSIAKPDMDTTIKGEDKGYNEKCEGCWIIPKVGENVDKNKHAQQEYYRATWYLGVRYLITALASLAAFQQYLFKVKTPRKFS